MIPNSGDRGGAPPEIKRLVSNSDIPIPLRLNAIFGSSSKENDPAKDGHPQEKEKGRKENGK